jgi:hypothetical protein
MLDLDVSSIGADWYVGNCHKWLMAPKGGGFLVASEQAKEDLHPLAVSHGYGQGSSQSLIGRVPATRQHSHITGWCVAQYLQRLVAECGTQVVGVPLCMRIT